jgi:hypothetical protein
MFSLLKETDIFKKSELKTELIPLLGMRIF